MNMSIFTENEKERTFKTVNKEGKEIELKIIDPKQAQLSQADLIYKSKFREALEAGVMTRAVAEKFIRENKVLDKETLDKRDEVAFKINDLRKTLSALTDKDRDEAFEIIQKINDLRGDLENISNLTLDIMNQTAESYAEDFRYQYLTAELTYTIDNKKYFSNWKNFTDNIGEISTIDAVKTAIFFFNNLNDNYEMGYEENSWLYEQGILNEDGTANIENITKEYGVGEKPDKITEKKATKKKVKKKAKKKVKDKTRKPELE